jgi:hypothetical protein
VVSSLRAREGDTKPRSVLSTLVRSVAPRTHARGRISNPSNQSSNLALPHAHAEETLLKIGNTCRFVPIDSAPAREGDTVKAVITTDAHFGVSDSAAVCGR